MGKFLAIDGFNIVRRVYEASDETEGPDRAATALRHALSSFRKLLATHEPTHAMAAFDVGGHTWRHDLYPPYRAHRAPLPADLGEGMHAFYEQLAGIGMAVVSVPGVEAEDAIATAVLRWLDEGRGDAVIASTDKDLLGLVAQGALLWDHFKGEWHDRQWIEEKFGVPPEMMPDLLALVGDPADGIPGITKVGVKTAAKLLHSYRDLQGIMAGAGILKNPLGERLRKEREQLDVSRKLVELKTDVRLGVTWKMLACGSSH